MKLNCELFNLKYDTSMSKYSLCYRQQLLLYDSGPLLVKYLFNGLNKISPTKSMSKSSYKNNK